MTTARWTFLRHGESVANLQGWLAGHTDVDLTERGAAEAVAVRGTLRDMPFARVLVSDLLRARRTLELALPDWDGPLVVDPRLRERTIGAWDGAQHKEAQAMALLTTWTGRPPGGESLADLALRAARALADLDTGADTLVVTHGGLMRAVLGVLDGRSPEAIGRVRYPNCAVQTRALRQGAWASLARALEDAPDGAADAGVAARR